MKMIQPENGSLESTRPSSRLEGDVLVQHLCKSLELRLRAGESVRSESIFADHPALADDPEQALDLIYTEFIARSELCEKPTTDEFIARFPQWRTLLERQFQLAEMLDDSVTRIEFSEIDGVVGDRCSVPIVNQRFRVGKLLARGGIGQVMRAVDTELNREVAVKEIRAEHSQNFDIRERFLREAEITGRLEHPGVVPVYGLGRDAQQRPFYAMRLVRGQSFQEAIEAFHADPNYSRHFRSLEFQKLLRRFLSVCETIGYAHSRGVTHRDLKPQNILLGPFGETLVVDWGLAKVIESSKTVADSVIENLVVDDSNQLGTDKEELHESDHSDAFSRKADWSVELTQTGEALIGTPAFMSPEQVCGESNTVGPPSDIYSLGATLFSLLTGQSRFGDSNVAETLRQVRDGSFPRPRKLNRRVPRVLEAICLKAMAQEPHSRYASPGDLASDIEHWLADEPVSIFREALIHRAARWGRRNRAPAILGLVVLMLVSAISTVAAFRINGERFRADQERIEARRGSARLAFDRGYQLTEQNEHGEAIHWFARALQNSPSGDRELRRVILTNMSAARNHLLRRKGTFSHDKSIQLHAFSKDGKLLLTADTSGLARIWNVDSGEKLCEHRLTPSRPVAAASADDGTFLVATAFKQTATIHKLSSSSNETIGSSVLVEHDESIRYAEFSPNGENIATGSRASGPTTIRVWRVSDGKLLSDRVNPCPIVHFAFLPQTRFIAVVGIDGYVRRWDWSDESSDFILMGSQDRAHRIAFTKDGNRLIIGTNDGAVVCWDVGKNRRLFEVARHVGSVTAVSCSSDNESVAAAWDNGSARTWSIKDRQTTFELFRINRYTSLLGFRPQSRQMLIMSEAQLATLLEFPDPLKSSIPLNQQSIAAIEFSSDGSLAITASRSGSARLRDGKTGESFGKSMSHQAAINRVAIRPDAAVVLTASADGTAKLWNAKDGSPRGQPLVHRKRPNDQVVVSCAAFSPDGQVAATGDNTGGIRLWNADTGELLLKLESISGPANSISFSPSGDRFLVGYADLDNLRMWRTTTGELLWKASHLGAVRSVVISSDGQVAVSASNDETARLWNVATGEPKGDVMKHRGQVFFARFSPDNSLTVTGGYDSTVRLWNVSNGSPFGMPMKHEAIVMDAVFSADGRRLLTGSIDKTARLWDVATCLPLSAPLIHSEGVFAVRIHPNGSLALTGRQWRLPSPLPDNPSIVERWVRLATERTFDTSNNIQWLEKATSTAEAGEFAALTGQSWSEWGN